MEERNSPELATLLGHGAATAAILVVGLGLGWLVDHVVHSVPAFTLAGLALGIVGAGVYIYTQFTKFLKE
ncbi:AtpZ/AtpI family protein [Mycobacterium sp.]|uniref:AtpZ/AtpI family protein n=1 Tax=Mycobacterium sp. TaxID=1785 RepID=UPI00262225BF|nr:AtpZ/AtpI family protein [Mycobacterium sp.]